mgnify:CR=1 FL=1
MVRFKLGVVPGILMLTACATPEVVDEQQVTDQQLSCDELEAEMEEAQRFEEAARDERGLTGTNAAAAIFFPPALLGTYANTEEAIEAAEDRQEHLMTIHDEKNCA